MRRRLRPTVPTDTARASWTGRRGCSTTPSATPPPPPPLQPITPPPVPFIPAATASATTAATPCSYDEDDKDDGATTSDDWEYGPAPPRPNFAPSGPFGGSPLLVGDLSDAARGGAASTADPSGSRGVAPDTRRAGVFRGDGPAGPPPPLRAAAHARIRRGVDADGSRHRKHRAGGVRLQRPQRPHRHPGDGGLQRRRRDTRAATERPCGPRCAREMCGADRRDVSQLGVQDALRRRARRRGPAEVRFFLLWGIFVPVFLFICFPCGRECAPAMLSQDGAALEEAVVAALARGVGQDWRKRDDVGRREGTTATRSGWPRSCGGTGWRRRGGSAGRRSRRCSAPSRRTDRRGWTNSSWGCGPRTSSTMTSSGTSTTLSGRRSETRSGSSGRRVRRPTPLTAPTARPTSGTWNL
mmetsp:Transcript_33485/g.66156  ORF Transcript_33485/g.66156 Transcript_33485/m.66156 type:complete len:412 (+) Transcript_33485:93-1328(+)